MKKILVGLFLLSNICFAWEYAEDFRYDLDKNIQLIGQSDTQTRYVTLAIIQVEDDVLCIGLTGNYAIDSIFNVKIYVDDVKIDEVQMIAGNTQAIQGVLTRKIVNAFKRGNTAIISFTHSNGSSTYKFLLAGFTKEFNKMHDISYYIF